MDREERLEGPAGSESGHGSGSPAPVDQFSPEVIEALIPQLKLVFKGKNVLNLDSLRELLRQETSSDVLRAAGEQHCVEALRRAIEDSGEFWCFRNSRYALKEAGPEEVRPIRTLVLQLLAEKERIEYEDVKAAAKEQGVPFDDIIFVRVMWKLCDQWLLSYSLKSGDL